MKKSEILRSITEMDLKIQSSIIEFNHMINFIDRKEPTIIGDSEIINRLDLITKSCENLMMKVGDIIE